jgi:threonine dehydrogenase-like Zn-dependent dehydrogenase
MRSITGAGAYGLGARVDVALECAGAAPSLDAALKSVPTGGTIVLAGVFGREVGVRIDRTVEKELRVRGTAAYRDEFPAVIGHLASGAVRADDFVSHTYALDQITEAFTKQMDSELSVKVQVRPDAA